MVVIKAREDSWLSISVDGEIVTRALLAAGTKNRYARRRKSPSRQAMLARSISNSTAKNFPRKGITEK